MEGVITISVAIFAFSFIIKFPDQEKIKPSWYVCHYRHICLQSTNASQGLP